MVVHPLSDGVGWGIVEGRMVEGMNLDDLANEYVSKAAVLAQKGDCYDAEGHLLYAVGTGNIMRLPAADVKPVVRGKWIPVTNGRGGHECSECHDYAPSYQVGSEHLANYCPNCGADMREQETKQDPAPDPKSTFYDLLYEEGGANTT